MPHPLQAHYVKNLRFLWEARLTPQMADEQAGDQKSGKIKAVATTFGPRETEDGRKFYYTAEAFSEWAEQYNENWQERPLPMFVNHMAEMIPVGEWTHVEMDDSEMRIEGQIFKETSAGRDMMKVLEASPRMMGGVSISPTAQDWRMVDESGEPIGSEDDLENGYFQITKGGMSEISVVTHAANKRAEITALEKFINGELNPRFVERALREQGLSRSQAVKAWDVMKGLVPAGTELSKVDRAGEPHKSFNEVTILEALAQRELLSRLVKRV